MIPALIITARALGGAALRERGKQRRSDIRTVSRRGMVGTKGQRQAARSERAAAQKRLGITNLSPDQRRNLSRMGAAVKAGDDKASQAKRTVNGSQRRAESAKGRQEKAAKDQASQSKRTVKGDQRRADARGGAAEKAAEDKASQAKRTVNGDQRRAESAKGRQEKAAKDKGKQAKRRVNGDQRRRESEKSRKEKAAQDEENRKERTVDGDKKRQESRDRVEREKAEGEEARKRDVPVKQVREEKAAAQEARTQRAAGAATANVITNRAALLITPAGTALLGAAAAAGFRVLGMAPRPRIRDTRRTVMSGQILGNKMKRAQEALALVS